MPCVLVDFFENSRKHRSKKQHRQYKSPCFANTHSLNFYKIFDFAVEFYEELVYNGRGRYAIVDMEEFEKTQATLKLMHELAKGEASAKEKGYIDISEVEDILEVAHG